MSEPILFEDTFIINSVNSAKYERVSRITAISTSSSNANDNINSEASADHPNPHSTALTLDVNTELYPLQTHDRIQVTLALTLDLEGGKDDGGGGGGGGGGRGGMNGTTAAAAATTRAGGWRDVASGDKRTLADEYDYVCYGKIYRFDEGAGDDM